MPARQPHLASREPGGVRPVNPAEMKEMSKTELLHTERRGTAPQNALAGEEARINRLVWASRVVLLALTAGVVSFFLLTQAEQPWQYLVYSLFAVTPVLYGVISDRYIRLSHVSLLRRHQAQLMMRTVELQEMASRDPLTQLYNRRYFYECLQAELEKARTSRQSLALLLLDVDGLKRINDELGHMAGDAVISNLAIVIAKHTRASDVAARLGGDEFGVVMQGTDKRGAFALAERLWEDLERTPMYEDGETSLNVNVSIGVSGFPWGGEDVDEMMHWADADMYANKLSRRLPPEPISTGDGPPTGGRTPPEIWEN